MALEGVVDNCALEDDAVRDENFYAVVAVKLAATGTDRGDGASEGADFHEIADADGAFEEEDEAADEVVGELLRAEADGDCGGAAEQGEYGEWDLDGGEGDEADKEEKRVVCELLDDRAGGGVEVQALAEARAEPAAKGRGNHAAHKQNR